MMCLSNRYMVQRSTYEKACFIALYTLSFSTLLYDVWFTFDLLIINLVFFQLPFFLITGNTFHGYIGGMKTIRGEKLPPKIIAIDVNSKTPPISQSISRKSA